MKKVEDYIKKYNVFTKEQCSSILKLIDEDEWEKNSWYEYTDFKKIDNDQELEVAYVPDRTYQNFINEKIFSCIKEYTNNLNFSVCNITNTKINRYKKNTRMLPHVDHIRSIFDGNKKGIPILTALIGLNSSEDYEGGMLLFNNIDLKVKLEVGEIIFFPSVFIYAHEILPVTKGVRFSGVNWMY